MTSSSSWIIAFLGALVAAPLPAQTQPANAANSRTQEASLHSREITPEERADIYLARKSYADAIDYYHRALGQQGSSANLWNKLGIAYQLDINYRAARKVIQQQ